MWDMCGVKMLFSNIKNIMIVNNFYLNDYTSVWGKIEANIIEGYLMPNSCSAVAKNISVGLAKQYNEYLERYRIGLNTFCDEELVCFNLLQKEEIKINRKEIGYGISERWGLLDTTGTASGYGTKKIINKAVSELIEKNELALFWFKTMGNSIRNCSIINKKIAEFGLQKRNIFIFSASNISSATAIMVIIFDEKRNYLASGIALDISPDIALHNAMAEAKLQLIINAVNYNTSFVLNEKENKAIYSHILYLKESTKMIEFSELRKAEKLQVKPWIANIYIALLNSHYNQITTTIRCFSDYLMNCVPTIDNINKCENNIIVSKYNLLDMSKKVDCIIT